MDPSQDARDRILAAADALYEQAGREVFLTVDAVRKAAKANMNEASTVMKEWRRTQARPASVAVQVPEPVQQAAGLAVVAIWQAAQEVANDALLTRCALHWWTYSSGLARPKPAPASYAPSWIGRTWLLPSSATLPARPARRQRTCGAG